MLERARVRATDLGVTTIEFVQADLQDVPQLGAFDALVGRLVLMYLPDPAAALRDLARRVRPGGIVAFQEIDLSTPVSCPDMPLYTELFRWMMAAFRAAGADPVMGLKLYATFRAAGLPEPELETVRLLGGGPGALVYPQGAMVVRSLLPVIVGHGIATAEEIDIDTFEERLRAEVVAGGGVVGMPMHVGARTRLNAG